MEVMSIVKALNTSIVLKYFAIREKSSKIALLHTVADMAAQLEMNKTPKDQQLPKMSTEQNKNGIEDLQKVIDQFSKQLKLEAPTIPDILEFAIHDMQGKHDGIIKELLDIEKEKAGMSC